MRILPSNELAQCSNCKGFADDLLYDENSESLFCDKECFDEWHDGNRAEVGEFYFKMNVGY